MKFRPFSNLALVTALTLLSPSLARATADSVIVFNEINYHPADEVNGTEWIELHSLMGVDVDISNWRLQDGVAFTFPEGTIVPGHGYVLIAANPASTSLSGLNPMGPFSGSLNNSGETIELANNSGRIMDSVSYGDDNDWPVGADGSGATLSKRKEDSSSASPSNWVASPTLVGSPAQINFPTGEEPADLVINEIAAADEPNFQIELANLGSTPINLAGFKIQSSVGPAYTLTSGTLNPGAHQALSAATLGFTPLSGDRLFLLRPGGTEIADARAVTNRLRGRSPDGRWLYPSSPSIGSPNLFNTTSDIVINEIMFSPRPIRSDAQSSTTVILDWDQAWRFNESGNDLGNTWETATHPLGGDWQQGPGPIGYETSALDIPIATNLAHPASNNPRVITYYFETEFTLTASQLANIGTLELSHIIDDGAVFYLNGSEISRFKMDSEPTTAASFANDGGESVLTTGVVVSSNDLVVGSNRLSVEVHQNVIGSSDIVFATKLEAIEASTPFQKSNNQWIELYNQGSSDIDLSGWAFTDGISFEFPTGTFLNSGEYLVLARDIALFSDEHPGVPVVGNWEGNLSRSGERLILRDSANNIADELRYFDDGNWPSQADGGGASLELLDPRADNSTAGSWQASDEGSRSDWQTYTYRASGQNHGNDPTQYNEFIFGLLDNGEFLLDDISVIENPDGAARELIQNGDFSGGNADTWRLIGTHRHAEVITDPSSPGNMVLHMATSGSAEHQHNHAGTTLKSGSSFVTLSSSAEYQISFRAKWLSGSNQFHTRLYFNRAARTTHLDTPSGGGTPGAPNSRALPNIGPALSKLHHSPAVPEAGAPITVSAIANDPDGIASLTLFYSVNGGAFASTPMTSGQNDSWSGIIPGQTAASKIQFYLQAVDSPGALSHLPARGPDSRAIIPVQDGQANLDYGDCQPNNLRIVMTNDDRDFMHTITNVMSNDRLGCTVIWNEDEIYYDCGVRLKGSQRGRPVDVRVGFNLRFPADQLFLGAHKTVAIDRSGSGSQFSQKEILVKHAINHAGGGIPGMEDDLIRVISPKTQHTGSAMLLKSRYDSEFLDNMYENGSDGTAWEYELIYYPTSTTGGPEGLKLPNPDSVAGVGAQSLGADKELYRWHWLIKNNRDADNYAPLMEMLESYGQGASASYLADMDRLLDVDQFLRSFAIQILFGVNDSYSSGSRHNAMFYQRPEDGKFLYFPWDMDFAFSRGATTSITPSGDLNKLLTSPANRRLYYGHLQDIISTTYNSSYMSPWATHYSCFLPSENLSSFISYINSRSSYATSQINSAIPATNFAITTQPTTTGDASINIEGNGWIDAREIRLAGSTEALPVTWTDTSSFVINMPIYFGSNVLVFEAYNHEDQLIGTDSVTITGTQPIIPAAAGNLVISELMFHPADSAGSDPDDYEFIELLNIHPTQTIDLTGVSFVEGIDFNFPSNTQLLPGERLIIARNQTAFISHYGDPGNIVGEYRAADGSNKLSNGGEAITLNDAQGTLILSFEYNDQAPWPTQADGGGYALELVNPTSGSTDPTQPINWRSSRLPGGSPGTDGDSTDLATWASANGITNLTLDPDHDGQTHLEEFLFNTNPFLADHPKISTSIIDETFIMEVTIRNGADGVTYSAQQSPDLINWTDALYQGRQSNQDGETETLFFSTTSPPLKTREFLRFLTQ